MSRGHDSLSQFPLFRSLNPKEAQRLDASCLWRRVPARASVLDHDSAGTDLFFVLRGHVRVVIAAANRDVILRDIRGGEFFGELAAIDGRPRSAGIIAVTDTVVASMPAALFRTVVHAHPDVCDQLLATLVAQVRALANRASEQSSLGARQRLYAELLRMARTPPDGSPPIVSPPPTHAELAARVSSHREAVTRELGAMERAGLILRRRGAIALLDANRLRALVADLQSG